MKKIVYIVIAFLFYSGCLLAQNDIKYINADNLPVFGKISEDTPGRYERLPKELQGKSRADVLYLGRQSAGVYIRFRSNSTTIKAKWTSTFQKVMPHMNPTGTRGLDLYVLEQNGWRYAGSAKPNLENAETNTTIIAHMIPEEREYMLYLSLYDGVSSLFIGIDKDSFITKPVIESPRTSKPIIYYGSSILQGGCVSRPGMVGTSILGRILNREIINLGFSGNALLDVDIAELMASAKDPGVFVLDYVPNTREALIRKKAHEFFKILRKAHPNVPIVFIEVPYYPKTSYDQVMLQDMKDRNEAQKELFLLLKRAKEKNIFYIPAEGMIGDDGEISVDGEHFTDLGMVRYCAHVLPTLRQALKKNR